MLLIVWERFPHWDKLACYLSTQDIRQLRLVCSGWGKQLKARLFSCARLSFDRNSLNETQIKALERIGFVIKRLTFHFPHSDETTLDPPIGPDGKQIYHRPPYGAGPRDQYSDLLHCGPRFRVAFEHMRGLRHLVINTLGKRPGPEARPDIVHDALRSLHFAAVVCPELTEISLLVYASSLTFIYYEPRPELLRVRQLYVTGTDEEEPQEFLRRALDYMLHITPEVKTLRVAWDGKSSRPMVVVERESGKSILTLDGAVARQTVRGRETAGSNPAVNEAVQILHQSVKPAAHSKLTGLWALLHRKIARNGGEPFEVAEWLGHLVGSVTDIGHPRLEPVHSSEVSQHPASTSDGTRDYHRYKRELQRKGALPAGRTRHVRPDDCDQQPCEPEAPVEDISPVQRDREKDQALQNTVHDTAEQKKALQMARQRVLKAFIPVAGSTI